MISFTIFNFCWKISNELIYSDVTQESRIVKPVLRDHPQKFSLLIQVEVMSNLIIILNSEKCFEMAPILQTILDLSK